MRYLVSCISILCLVSCGHSPLVSHLQGADSVSIIFKQPVTQQVTKIVGTAGPYAIQDLLTYAGSSKTEPKKCGYDGDIIFFKKGSKAGEISFNYKTEGCHHFLINKDGALIATEMNNQAVDLLKQLAGDNP